MSLHVCRGPFRADRLSTLQVIAICTALTVVTPLFAEVVIIDPGEPPDVVIPPDEAERLAQLLSADYSYPLSAISPDGAAVVAWIPPALVFLDVESGETVPISFDFFNYLQLSELRWRDGKTLIFVGRDAEETTVLVTVNRETGAVDSAPLELPAEAFDLSPGGRRVLMWHIIESESSFRGRGRQKATLEPFESMPIAPGYLGPGPVPFESRDRLHVRVARFQLQFSVFDLKTGQEELLFEIDPRTAIPAIVWAPRANRLAIVRSRFPDNTRGGGIPDDGPSVRDALGQLPPEENPFFTENVLDIFEFHGPHMRHRQLRPEVNDQAIFAYAVWNPTGHLLLTQMWHPGTIEGRPYPTFGNPNSSSYRFYLPNGWLLQEVARPEIDALYGIPKFISPYEAVFDVADGMTFSLYRYNLFTRRLKRYPTPEGTIFQSEINVRNKEIVYGFGAFDQPWEIFRVGMGIDEPVQLTHRNTAPFEHNRIRVDKLYFNLSSGEERVGYLVQPLDGEFPPDNVPLVVWQQGGPTSSMSNRWGGSVEMPFNILPNFGMAMLMVPLPGRDGFSGEFLDGLADDRNFGQIDIDEQLEIIEQLYAMGITSPDRIGVTGCSYGGYFSSQSVTRHPDAYAAVNPQCTLINLFHEWEFGYKPYLTYLVGRLPQDDWDEYYADSPLQRAELVRTPTLIFSGSVDFLPASFSWEFHDGINAAGTPADYYQFEGEGHGLRQFNSQFVAAQAQINWFRHYLAH